MNKIEQKSDKADNTALTVYYDGGCPLCSKEIQWYQKCHGGENICWQDVSSGNNPEVADDLSKADAMQRFHVRKSDGTLVSGAFAFSELWENLPSLKIAGKITKLPIISHAAEALYKVFLRHRNRPN